MLEIICDENGQINLSGRFDAAQVDKAQAVFTSITSSCVVNMEDLDYISSAGLGVLLHTYKRLNDSGHTMVLINMNDYVRKIFQVSGLDRIFRID